MNHFSRDGTMEVHKNFKVSNWKMQGNAFYKMKKSGIFSKGKLFTKNETRMLLLRNIFMC